MWAIGRYDFGLSEDEFWSLTPREFDVLFGRWEKKLEREDYQAAKICSIVAECHRNEEKKKQPFTPADFMFKKRLRTEMSDEEMLSEIERLNIIFGGVDKREKHG